MNTTLDGATPGLDRFRAAVLSDPSLVETLGACEDRESFIPLAIAQAERLGIALTADALRTALRDDPLGMARFSGGPPTADRPPAGWLPIQIAPLFGQLCVDWAYFGPRPLREPFFEESIRIALRLPINVLVPRRTLLADLPGVVEAFPVLQPSGFIFHMSRCGSTLASQMLAADPRNIVLSEPAPLDFVVQLDHRIADLPPDVHAILLRSVVGALGHRRAPAQERVFVKLDSWHTRMLPLFRRAFPDVPWAFLYREPADVLASQVQERGLQTVPEFLPPRVYGLTEDERFLPPEEYCACVLAKTCEAVLEPYAQGKGLLVNYRELPQALWTGILPHFGVRSDEQERSAMAHTASFDAKSPGFSFSPRNAANAQGMSDELRAVADKRIGPIYNALEILRGRARGDAI